MRSLRDAYLYQGFTANAKPAVLLNFYRQPDSNTVESGHRQSMRR